MRLRPGDMVWVAGDERIWVVRKVDRGEVWVDTTSHGVSTRRRVFRADVTKVPEIPLPPKEGR